MKRKCSDYLDLSSHLVVHSCHTVNVELVDIEMVFFDSDYLPEQSDSHSGISGVMAYLLDVASQPDMDSQKKASIEDSPDNYLVLRRSQRECYFQNLKHYLEMTNHQMIEKNRRCS
ncbi:MAG TPA: hypothetical protein PKV44_02805 [Bacillota bacterium]|nr:hypothetical protein [Bacillota bacterium]